MKLLTSPQGTVLFNGLLDLILSWGVLNAENEKTDETLDGKTASGIVAWSL